MKKLLIFLTVAVFSASTMALNSAYAPVTSLSYSEGGNLYFTTSAQKINPAGCSNVSYVIPGTNPRIKNYYAMLLTASASNQNVLVRIHDTTCTLGGAYPWVVLLQMTN